MAKYQVIRPWSGVTMGQIVDLKEVHPSLKANVMEVGKGAGSSDEAGDVLAKAHAEAAALREQTEAELTKRAAEAQAEAQADAQTIIDEANAEAERIKAEAIKQAGELTPATPEATSKTAKTK